MMDNPFAADYVEATEYFDEVIAPTVKASRVVFHDDYEQGSIQWLAARCGLLTASTMKHVITPTLKIANNDKTTQHLYELLAQRITGFTEPQYLSDAMLRGHSDEILAREEYEKSRGVKVRQVGLVTNDKWGFTLGCSPDGLVNDDGGIEAKSRGQKYQVQTIIEHLPADTIMSEFVMQVQTCLAVCERQWWDTISYSGGLPSAVVRVFPDPVIIDAIVNAAGSFEHKIAAKMAEYHEIVASRKLVATERSVEVEMHL